MNRPVLYLLPGLLCDETVFAAQVAGLSDICEVRVPAFRGLGSFDEMAAAVLDTAPERFSIAGFSMGGRVAFRIAALAMGRLERFCAFDTGAGPVGDGEIEKRQAVIDLAWREGMEALARSWLPPMLHPSRRSDPAFIAPLTEMILRSTAEDHEKQIRALINRPDAWPVLPTINVPTLIACGREDEWSPPAHHEAMAAAIPGARLVIIENCGHFLPVEQPEAFTRALREWMTTPARA